MLRAAKTVVEEYAATTQNHRWPPKPPLHSDKATTLVKNTHVTKRRRFLNERRQALNDVVSRRRESFSGNDDSELAELELELLLLLLLLVETLIAILFNSNYGVNILQNSALPDGTNGWTPLGNCTLSVATGSLQTRSEPHERLSGNYILMMNRIQAWNGPSQKITNKVKMFLTYQVSAWVRSGHNGSGPQKVEVALSVDGQWMNGGQTEIEDDLWHEISGSFRIENQPAREVMVYVQGPVSGVDLMVAGLQIFAVDRAAQFRHLKKQTEKIQKRDVVLKFTGPGASGVAGTC
uniref:CBM-cenC domain-containing protein n=1 Tax=Kalanchoe fedtschenkoi TaxID=63787 RepID=A0A7N0UXG4_KALFE